MLLNPFQKSISDINEGQRIGVFPGTFNPIHLGHIQSAEKIKDKFNLDFVIFLPCGRTRRKQGVVYGKHRFEMIQKMIQDRKNLFVTDQEVNHKGYSNIADTFFNLKTKAGKNSELFFLMGEDILEEIGNWSDVSSVRKLLKVSTIICMKRKSRQTDYSFLATKKLLKSNFNVLLNTIDIEFDTSPFVASTLKDGSQSHLIYVDAFITDGDNSGISSTLVRKYCNEDRDVRPLVGKDVSDYIKKYGFYKRRPISKLYPYNPTNNIKNQEPSDLNALNLII